MLLLLLLLLFIMVCDCLTSSGKRNFYCSFKTTQYVFTVSSMMVSVCTFMMKMMTMMERFVGSFVCVIMQAACNGEEAE